ncbi:hypothetical protein Taro_016691 [Colocasia esculenta]|uniref:Thioredoxin domain-containing protein n=1 Tax=Colocasia esculenta TaxID=4460 RepID=A0A843UWZ9_COLES|nr:hypothetical protein [Colocasia esculenta]
MDGEGSGEGGGVKCSEGAGLNLPPSRHQNLRTASDDQQLKEILLNIRSTKSSVRSSPAPFPFPFLLLLLLLKEVDTEFVVVVGFCEMGAQAVINYGASWCRVCSQILPNFCHLSNDFPKLSFVYADIDECPETTQHIRYTPTFHFFRDGERVDEMLGGGEERLHDRLWLHS